MQRAIARGYRPTRAAQLASAALARHRDESEDSDFAPPSETDLYESLLNMERSLATLREMLFPGRGARG